MKCPVCDAELVKEFYEGVIDFRCQGCGGRIMTVSGLRSICADHRFVNLLWNTAQYGYSETGPICPSCKKTMRRVTLPLSGIALELDLCRACQMVWFDPGELKRIPLPRPGGELPQKAREILARHQVEIEEENLQDDEVTPEAGWKYLAGWLGMPVELNAPEVRRKPVLTWSIAFACLIVFGLTLPDLQSAVDNWGFIPAQWTRHGGLTVLTSMFLHGGILHLIGNLYFLLILGDNVEDEFGRLKYLFLLIASGLCATLLYGAFHSGSNIPCIGASGFISGVIACYAVCFPRVKLSFLIWSRSFIAALMTGRSWFAVPAWSVFGIWILLQIVMASIAKSDAGGVAYMAHIGGAIPGILFAIVWRCRRKRAFRDPSKSLDDLKNAKNL